MTTGHFDGKVAVVTGASRGLGAAYARLLAAEGARVVVNGRPPHLSPTPASQVVAAIEAAGGEAVADFHDVTTDGAAVVATALDRWGPSTSSSTMPAARAAAPWRRCSRRTWTSSST